MMHSVAQYTNETGYPEIQDPLNSHATPASASMLKETLKSSKPSTP